MRWNKKFYIMLVYLRSGLSLNYRLFFVMLFLLVGLCSVGVVILEKIADISVFNISGSDKQTLHATLSILGIMSMTIAFILGGLLLFIRTNLSLLYFRIFFIASFLVLGVSSLTVSALEQLMNLNIIAMESEHDKKALHATLNLLGIMGIAIGSIMTYLIREKRQLGIDRREQSITTAAGVANRRTKHDRRQAR